MQKAGSFRSLGEKQRSVVQHRQKRRSYNGKVMGSDSWCVMSEFCRVRRCFALRASAQWVKSEMCSPKDRRQRSKSGTLRTKTAFNQPRWEGRDARIVGIPPTTQEVPVLHLRSQQTPFCCHIIFCCWSPRCSIIRRTHCIHMKSNRIGFSWVLGQTMGHIEHMLSFCQSGNSCLITKSESGSALFAKNVNICTELFAGSCCLSSIYVWKVKREKSFVVVAKQAVTSWISQKGKSIFNSV